MRIAMVSEHADPAAVVGETDAGGQNVHVGSLSAALAERGHSVTVYTRLTGPEARRSAEFRPGVIVRRLPAGPIAPLPKDELLPFMPEFGDQMARLWQQDRPDIIHAHFWMSGLAALSAAAGLPVPVVQTFHALGVVKARHQGAADPSPANRAELERRIAQSCDQVIATCRDEASELTRAGVPSGQISVVPCGVDTSVFTPHGPAARNWWWPAARATATWTPVPTTACCAKPHAGTASRTGFCSPAASPGPMCRRSSAPRT
jgi:D-inositol-3-phosphate glycosyltransferase